MNIFNSITKGFGFGIGNQMARKVMNPSSSKIQADRNYLSFWEGIKTILWFIPMFLLAIVMNSIYNMFTGDFIKANWHPNFTAASIMAIVFCLIIGQGYYNKTK